MKTTHLLSIILISILIAAGIHYLEYHSIHAKSDDFCPDNIPCFHDYEKGLKAAQKWRKPIALYFTGWIGGCCGAFDKQLFGDKTTQQLLAKEYVLVTLFVDEKNLLPLSEQFEYINHKGEKRRIEEVGDKWQYFQINCFNNNSNLMIALLNPYEELLQKKPIGYVKSEELNIYLQAGLQNFQKGVSEGKIECDFEN